MTDKAHHHIFFLPEETFTILFDFDKFVVAASLACIVFRWFSDERALNDKWIVMTKSYNWIDQEW